MMPKSSLLYPLGESPVLGVSFANVRVLRLDLLGGNAPGNKWFKLQGSIAEAGRLGLTTLVSFGGAWSNHLHALAATGRELGLRTVGIVRGEEPANPSAMLRDARRWGMELVYVSRSEYRQRDQPGYIEEVLTRFGPCLLIPEGGANRAGVEGCGGIADLLRRAGVSEGRVVLAVGTGTTLAGVANGLGRTPGKNPGPAVVGISVLKGAADIEPRIATFTNNNAAPWQVLHDHHCGGYARVSAGMREFIVAFQQIHGIPLDPVYTGKALYGVHQLIASRAWGEGEPVVVIHTGGLQGRRGFSWLR